MGLFSGPRRGSSVTPTHAELDRILAGTSGGVDMQQLRSFFGISSWTDLIPRRPGTSATALPVVTPDMALRNSAVWACLRLRADLVSTLPINTFRTVRLPDSTTIDVAAPTPPVLRYPGGEKVGIC